MVLNEPTIGHKKLNKFVLLVIFICGFLPNINKNAFANPKAQSVNSQEQITTKDDSVSVRRNKIRLYVANSVDEIINTKIQYIDNQDNLIIKSIVEMSIAEINLPTQTVAIPRKVEENNDIFLCEEDCFVSQVKLAPFLAQLFPDWETSIAEVTLPTQTVAIPRKVEENNDNFVSDVKLTPFLAQLFPDWEASIAEVTLPTQTVAIPRKVEENNDIFLCEEDCFVSDVKLTPFLAQAFGDWEASIAEVTLPTQTVAIPRKVEENNDNFVSDVKLTPFLAQLFPDWETSIAEVTLPTQTVAIPRKVEENNDNFVSEVKLTPFLAQLFPDWETSIAEVTLPTQTVAIPRKVEENNDNFVSEVKLTPFLAQLFPDWETSIAEVTLPTQTVAIPRKVDNNNNILLCEEDCFVSEVKLTPFLAQLFPDWETSIAEVTLPTQTVAIPRKVEENNNILLCEEDCFVSQVKLTPFLAQAFGDWETSIAEVTLPTQTVAIPRKVENNNDILLCEEDCFVSEVKLTPFLAQAFGDWEDSIAEVTLPPQRVAEVAPLDRTLDPKPPITDPSRKVTPDPTIESPSETPSTTKPVKATHQMVEMLIENAISNTAVRYPWIVNGSDNLTFSPFIFKPRTNELYLNLDLRDAPDNPVLNKVGVGVFPFVHQLYWVLEDNIIIGDISGGLAGIVYQGKQTNQTFLQTLSQRQSFSGYQAAWVIPNDLQRLFKLEDLDNYQVISLGGQLVNPEGIPAGEVTFNTDGLINEGQEVIILPSPQAVNDSQIGVASTFHPKGGGALFANLDVKNAPLILQGFPTSDLRALASLDFKKNTIIPKEILQEAGISWTNPITGEGTPVFSPDITSTPGIKIAQPSKFDNIDLLNILVNPFLDEKQRDLHYWNSLLWLGLGIQPPEINTFQISENKYDWYRIYASALNNRFLLQYSKDKPEATFYNLFANPGFSFTVPSAEGGRLDEVQSLNSTIGMVMGAFFDFVDLEILDKSIQEAKKQRNNNEIFKTLDTKATSEERKEINLRINTTLAFANLGSNLNQVSGYVTFPSVITPTSSGIFQIKTGNIQRAVQFVQSDIGEWREGETTVQSARLSNRSFGPLTFLGNALPIQPIGFENSNQGTNESSGSKVILVSPEGKQFVQEFNSKYLTAIPNAIKTFDLAFDRIVLERSFVRNIENKIYNGYLYLPTVELVYAGTSDDWNYSINPGIWFNVNNQAAGEVKRNDFGIPEPSVGVYINTVVSKTITDVEFDDQKQLSAINTHVPFFRFSWNSANNGNNPWQITLAYTYSRQTRTYGLSTTASVGYIPQYGNGPFVGFLNGRLGFFSGPTLKANIELGDQIYYNAELLQKILSTVSIGPYIRNYIDLNEGFNSRELEVSYGGIIEYKLTDSPVSMRLELGTTESNEFIGSIKGDIRF